jgi:hypothetical protein
VSDLDNACLHICVCVCAGEVAETELVQLNGKSTATAVTYNYDVQGGVYYQITDSSFMYTVPIE